MLNIRSLYSKTTYLANAIRSRSIKIMAVVETWLDASISYNELFFSGYHSHRIDRPSRAGGVLFLVDDNFHSDIENCYIDEHIEYIHIAVERLYSKPLQLIAVYRPPCGSIDLFLDALSNLLNNINYTSLPTIIMGDININLLAKTCNSAKFKNILRSYAIEVVNKSPTRISDRSSTLIDIVGANMLALRYSGPVSTDHVSFSDHCMLYFTLKKRRNKKGFRQIFRPNLNAKNCADIVGKIRTWDFLPVDDFAAAIQSEISNLPKTCVHVPVVKNCPWLDKALMRLLENRDRLSSLASKYKTSSLMRLSEQAKINCKLSIRTAKRNYFSSLFNSARGDPKKIWSILTPLLKSNASNRKFAVMQNGIKVTCPVKIANIFNDYFINCVQCLCESQHVANLDVPPYPLSAVFDFVAPSHSLIECIIRKISSKPTGYFGVPFSILRVDVPFFARTICDFVTASFSSSVFPSCWKKAIVSPIHKSGSTSTISNFRPISVLPNMGQLLERVAHSQICSFLDTTKLLFRYQFGFRAKHSTKHACTCLLDEIIVARDSNLFCAVAFVDLSKAFDTINHEILIAKLSRQFGFSSAAADWVKSYLTNREQRVCVEGVESDFLPVSSGVPQGSILGPLLFIMFINDMWHSLAHSRLILYADDASLLVTASTTASLQDKLNFDLNSLAEYCCKHKLFINTKKTKVMVFSPTCPSLDNLIFNIRGENIEIVDTFKYLGYHFDRRLSFTSEASHICAKLSRGSSIIARCKAFLDCKLLFNLFNCLILPYINYSHTMLAFTNKRDFLKLESIYNNVGKIIYSCVRSDLSRRNWLDLRFRILVSNYIFLYGIIYKFHAPPLADSLKPIEKKYFTRSTHSFLHPRSNKQSSCRMFRHWAPRLWDMLPVTLRSDVSDYGFRILLYEFISKEYDEIWSHITK